MWKVWAKALGGKEFEEDHLADRVAIVRTFLVLINTITCFVIILNAWRHW